MLSKYLHILALSNVAIAAPQPFLRRDSSIPPVTHTATATTDVFAAAATAATVELHRPGGRWETRRVAVADGRATVVWG